MNLKCKINGKEHKITQGATFSEEYNETLDSGNVIITSKEQLDIKPYDDVFIYDNEFNGYNFELAPKTAYSYSEQKQISDYNKKLYLNKNLLELDTKATCKANIEYHPKRDNYTINFSTSRTGDRAFLTEIKNTSFNFVDFYYVENPFDRNEVYFWGGFEITEDGSKIPNLKLRKTTPTFSGYTDSTEIYNLNTKSLITYQELSFGLRNIKPVILKRLHVSDKQTIEIYFITKISSTGNPFVARMTFRSTAVKVNFELVGGFPKDLNVMPLSLCADYKNNRLYVSTYNSGSLIVPGQSNSRIYCFDVKTKTAVPEMVDEGMTVEGQQMDFPIDPFYSAFVSNEDESIMYLYTGGYKIKMSDYKTISSKKTGWLFSKNCLAFSPVVTTTVRGATSFGFVKMSLARGFVYYNFYDYTGKARIDEAMEYPKEMLNSTINIVSNTDVTVELSYYKFEIDFNFQLPEIDYDKVVKQTCVSTFSKTNNEITLNLTPPSNAIIQKNFIFTQDAEKANKLSTEIDYSQRKILVDIEFVVEFNVMQPKLDPKEHNNFYKHLLVNSVSEEIVNLKEKIYRYKIALFSETKGLEIVQLPNKSITQPLKTGRKKNVYTYAKEILELYNPKIKMRDSRFGDTWSLVPKYSLDKKIEEDFKDAISPDFSENNPNLRDFLAKLFVVKDKIPVVKDDIIYAWDITERKGVFDLNKGQINYINSSLSSENYCNNLKKNYNEALSQVGSGRYVEYLGFRNSDTALMTLENMRIETKFPIYKINKIYMCYYKKMAFKKKTDSTLNVKTFLCKQDITPLVKLNSERNLLSQDWDDFAKTAPNSIDEMAKYKLCTIGYDIGSKHLTGWGTKYKYPVGWWEGDKTATYIENIATNLDRINPYGIYNFDYLVRNIDGNDNLDYHLSNYSTDFFENLVAPTATVINDDTNKFNKPVKLKCFTFIIDYEPFYSGTIIHSKNFGEKDITINDNPSASLTLLEADGLYTQEKLNRYGNKNIMIPARYTNFGDLQELGSVYNQGKDTDVVIYHREYSVFNNLINCTYYGSKDYVLKNYFTTVWARHRTYNLMGYGESITRAENKKMYLLMSKKSAYYEKQSDKNLFVFKNFGNTSFLKQIFSFFKENEKAITPNFFKENDKINFAYFEKNGKRYVTDVNTFVSGNSLCLNICMFDNIMVGTYIKTFTPFDNRSLKDMLIPTTDTIDDDYTGSVQGWYNLVDDNETGRIEKISFYFSHFDLTEKLMDDVFNFDYYNEKDIKNIYQNFLFKLPFIKSDTLEKQTNIIGCEDYPIYKDNKEKLDFTLQFETITDDENIMFSPWMMKLGNLITPYKKTYNDYTVEITNNDSSFFELVASTFRREEYKGQILPNLFLRFGKTIFDTLNPCRAIGEAVWGKDIMIFTEKVFNVIVGFFLTVKKIKTISEESVTLICDYRLKVNWAFGWGNITEEFTPDVELTFKRIYNNGTNTDYIDDDFYKDHLFFKHEWKQISFVDRKGKKHKFGTSASILEGEDGLIKCSNDKKYTIFNRLSPSTSIITRCITYSDNDKPLMQTYPKNLYIAYTKDNLKKETVYDEFETWKFNNPNTGKSDYSENVSFGIVEEENEIPYLQILVDKSIITKNDKGEYGSVRLYFFDDVGDKWYHFVFGVNITEEEYSSTIIGNGSEFCRIKIYLSALYTKDNHIYDENHNLIGENQNYVKNKNKTYGQNQYFYDIIK